jgi:hypothetical protein
VVLSQFQLQVGWMCLFGASAAVGCLRWDRCAGGFSSMFHAVSVY